MNKQLFRSKHNKMVAGVCGGIGTYFDIDPTIIRIVWVICSFSGIGIVAYIISAIVIPEESETSYSYNPGQSEGTSNFKNSINFDSTNTNLIIGGILVFLGVILVARRYMPWFDSKLVWSLILIGLGLLVIFKGGRKR